MALLLLALSVLPGLYFWWPSRQDPTCRSNLGSALLTGAMVAFGVLFLQLLFEDRFTTLEETRSRERERDQARQQLILQIGLQKDLSNIDLAGRKDLVGLYLSGKILSGANLSNTDLRGAQFVQTTLDGSAQLVDADLRGADLRRANLEGSFLNRAKLQRALLNQACLQGADLSGAKLNGADFSAADLRGTIFDGAEMIVGAALGGAAYDEQTRWPEGFTPTGPPSDSAICER